MHDDTTCAMCRHRIYKRASNMRWDLVYKLYDGDTTLCTITMHNHVPMGLTDVPEDATVTP